MLRNRNNLALFTKVALAVLTLGLLAPVQAQDKKGDPAGTWTWTVPGRNGGPERKMTLKLKVEGDKLTGKLTSPARGGETRDTEIKDGKVKGSEISFTISREINGNTFTTKYTGKVTEEAIKGKVEFERNGESRSRDWEAKRVADKK
jgi:hypothetical protein